MNKLTVSLCWLFGLGSLLVAHPISAHSEPLTIKMTDEGFKPQEISLDSDSTLVFENADTKDHWPASDIHPTHEIYPQFDPQRPIKTGEVWQFKPTRVGLFKYHDHLNPHSKGILEIAGDQLPPASQVDSLDLQAEVDRIVAAGFLRLKEQNEDQGSYLRSQMDYCFKNGGRDFCYKDLAYLLSYQFDLPAILDLLTKNESYHEVFARCHELTHYLTRLAYAKVRNISTIYDQCTSVCHGGCYHGAIEQYLSDKKLSLDNFAKINQEIPKVCGKGSDYKVPLLYDECVHGIGHGTMYINDGDLIAALNLCDYLPSQQDQQTCYSGAFMENSSSSTNLDHPSKYIKADDPMYPCNILEQKYLSICYRYQSSHFAIISQSNWAEVAKLCQKVPKDYQKMCFLTVGSNQVGFSQDFKTISDDCDLMPTSEAKDYCFQGAVDALAIRYRNDFSKGVQFCSSIDSRFQKSCFAQYGHSVSSWSNDPNNRIKLCGSIRNLKFISWCKNEKSLLASLIDSLKQWLTKFNQSKNNQDFQGLTSLGQIDALKKMTQSQGVEKAWLFFSQQFKNEGGGIGQIHDLAHLMGGLIYDAKGFEGLKICTPSFAFGCFHGFLDKAFVSSLEKLNQAETACESLGSGGPVASCIHGIGHGVASFYQTANLNSALVACDKLKTNQQYCYDGVFMEFSRNAPAAFYRADDPLYPCDDIAEKYVYSCGRNQPNVLMKRLNKSFETVADFCAGAQDQNFKSACVTALGFITAAQSYGQADSILASCGRIKDPQAVSQCATAAAGELIFQDITGWRQQAPRICDSLDGDGQTDCHNYLQGIKKDYRRS